MIDISQYDGGMNIADIRHENLILLLDNECGRRRGASKVMAEKLDLEPNQVSHWKTRYRKIGDKLARKIEVAFKKPNGWMDVRHPEYGIAAGAAQYIISTEGSGKIPMLKSSTVLKFLERGEVNKGTTLVDEPFKNASHIKCFAYKEENNLNDPILPEGTIYIVQPMAVTKLPCLGAVLLNNHIVVGLYDETPFGNHIIFSDKTKKDLPEDSKFLGRILEIKPPIYSR